MSMWVRFLVRSRHNAIHALGVSQVSGMPPVNCHRGRSGSRGCPPGDYFLRQVDLLPTHAREWAILRQRDGVVDGCFFGVDRYLGDEPAQEVSCPRRAAGGLDEAFRVFPDPLGSAWSGCVHVLRRTAGGHLPLPAPWRCSPRSGPFAAPCR